MSTTTSATSTLKISAGVPATFDAAGYAALSYTTVGEITNIGDFGREYQLITHNPIATRGTQKAKGAYNEGALDLQLALDIVDAGQILLKAAAFSDSLYAFKITTTVNGRVYYFQGATMSFKTGVKDVNALVSATCKIELTTSSTGVGIVEV